MTYEGAIGRTNKDTDEHYLEIISRNHNVRRHDHYTIHTKIKDKNTIKTVKKRPHHTQQQIPSQ